MFDSALKRDSNRRKRCTRSTLRSTRGRRDHHSFPRSDGQPTTAKRSDGDRWSAARVRLSAPSPTHARMLLKREVLWNIPASSGVPLRPAILQRGDRMAVPYVFRLVFERRRAEAQHGCFSRDVTPLSPAARPDHNYTVAVVSRWDSSVNACQHRHRNGARLAARGPLRRPAPASQVTLPHQIGSTTYSRPSVLWAAAAACYASLELQIFFFILIFSTVAFED